MLVFIPVWKPPLSFVFNRTNVFRAVLGSQQNWEEDKRDFPCAPSPTPTQPHHLTDTHKHKIPHYQHSPQSGIFVKTQEPALIHNNHPKPLFYISVLSWCCMSYEFWQMHDDMYPSLFTLQNSFTAYSLLPCLHFLATDHFILSKVLSCLQ